MAYSGKPTGLTPGTYGDSTHVAAVTVNSAGQITGVSSTAISAGGSGTVTSIGVSSTDLTVSGSPVTTSGTISLDLTNSGASAGTYGDGSHVAQVTVDAKGRVTAVANVGITTGGTGTVTSVGLSSTDLTVSGSPVTTSGTIIADLTETGVTPGAYGDSTHVAQVTVDSKGRITSVASVAISGGGGGTPTFRAGAAYAYASASSFSVTFPAGTTAGDVVVVFISGAYEFNPVAGWVQHVNAIGTNWNGAIYSRRVTASDVTAGAVSVTAAGSYSATAGAASIVGADNLVIVQPINYVRSSTGAASSSVATDYSPTTQDLAIYFGSQREASAQTTTCDQGTLVQQASVANGTCAVYQGVVPSNAGFTAGFSFTAAGSGIFDAVAVMRLT